MSHNQSTPSTMRHHTRSSSVGALGMMTPPSGDGTLTVLPSGRNGAIFDRMATLSRPIRRKRHCQRLKFRSAD